MRLEGMWNPLLQELGTWSVEIYFRRRSRSDAHESSYPLLLCAQRGTVDSGEFRAVGGEPRVSTLGTELGRLTGSQPRARRLLLTPFPPILPTSERKTLSQQTI